MPRKHLTFIGTNNLLADLFRERDYFVEQYGRSTKVKIDFTDEDIDKQIELLLKQSNSDIFILLSGHLQSSDLIKQTQENRINSFLINSIGPVLFSEYILKKKANARIIIIGSESGMKGSYDLTYALAKSSLRMYVRQKRIGINQQLLLLSPSTIEDLGMTTRRKDIHNLKEYKIGHPKKSFLMSEELVEIICFLINSPKYLTNTEIEINGGKFTLMK